jgi:hypothetical protein
MFSYTLKQFFEKNFLLSLEYENIKIIAGTIFNEQTLVQSYKNNNKTFNTTINNFDDSKMIIDSDNNQENTTTSFSKNESIYYIINKIKHLNEKDMINFFENCQYIIITHIEDIVSWPYVIKKFKLDKENIKFVSTEPITQISRFYLKEFYDIFNKLIINLEDDSELNTETTTNSINNINTYLEEIELNTFVDNIIKLNYNEKLDIEPYLKLTLVSSGYNLGSSNILFNFYDKTVLVFCLSSYFNYRYTKALDIEIIKKCDIMINMPLIINNKYDNVGEISKLIETIYKVTSLSDIQSLHRPTIFMPCDVLFILDIVDILRYKVPNDVKTIYISKYIKQILSYCNINHGFINPVIHNKIYEF